MGGIEFLKGHGTQNDFVLLPDAAGRLDLTEARVAALCDRHRGLGADGVLRVVRAAALDVESAGEWFMDYRNADGSLAEMCGNGTRVYARYLVESGLAFGDRIAILTRSGRVVADLVGEDIAVDLPVPDVGGVSSAHMSERDFAGTVATCGNPNLVCWVDDPAALDLRDRPMLDPTVFPSGANVEFIAPVSANHVTMRVVERGVGETLSCGSGACAVAAVVLATNLPANSVPANSVAANSVPGGSAPAGPGPVQGTVTVDVPGGRLTVTLAGGRCVLSGPAVIVASGTVTVAWPVPA
jgi:diaminopimelate epimerase